MEVDVYCGGAVETNGYLVRQGDAAILVDAPEGMADWVRDRGRSMKFQPLGLLLTHGHWDHIADARAIQQRFDAPVWIHRDSAPLLEKPAIQAAFNPFLELKPCKPDRLIESEGPATLANFGFDCLFCPGHCPGSVCFYFSTEKLLFGGDVLFAGGVGRWDLPGGSHEELMASIASRLLALPSETRVFPGHGRETTMGGERRGNPFLAGLKSTVQRA